MIPPPPTSTLFPYTTLFRSSPDGRRRHSARNLRADLRRRSVRRCVGEIVLQHIDGLTVGEDPRSEEHTSELQSQSKLVCRLLREKKNSTQHGQRAGTRFDPV